MTKLLIKLQWEWSCPFVFITSFCCRQITEFTFLLEMAAKSHKFSGWILHCTLASKPSSALQIPNTQGLNITVCFKGVIFCIAKCTSQYIFKIYSLYDSYRSCFQVLCSSKCINGNQALNRCTFLPQLPPDRLHHKRFFKNIANESS